MNLSLIVVALSLLVGSVNGRKVPIEDFIGTWVGPVEVETVSLLVNGTVGVVCRDQLPSDCLEEIPPGIETYTFGNDTISTDFIHLRGITRRRQSAKAFPVCASLGYHPVQTAMTLTEHAIISYDTESGNLEFENPETGTAYCQIATLASNEEDGNLYLNVEHLIREQGLIAEIAETGVVHQCHDPPSDCLVTTSEDGTLTMEFRDVFQLSCVDGDCLELSNSVTSGSAVESKEAPESQDVYDSLDLDEELREVAMSPMIG